MIYKRFTVHVVLLAIFFGAALLVLLYLALNTDLYATTLMTGLLAIGILVQLIRYVSKTNRDLIRFFQGIRSHDFSQVYHDGGRGSTFTWLTDEMNRIVSIFKEERIVHEAQYVYLRAIIQQLGTAIITFDRDGKVHLINQAAIKLLRSTQITSIDHLRTISPELANAVDHIKTGEQSLVETRLGDRTLQLAVNGTMLRLQDRPFKLISLQDIGPELEEQELEAWHQLIHVLTHEIMNSLTPITSLSKTMHDMVEAGKTNGENILSKEDLDDLVTGIATIHGRSEGLLKFVDSYRHLAHVPKPAFQIVQVTDLLARIENLLSSEVSEKGIELHVTVKPATVEITADPALMEQVLLNLCRNAIQALEDQSNAQIAIVAGLNRNSQPYISITDNGVGIEAEVLEKIFIPFFTTRMTGTGIGLALCREIIRLHRGNIMVDSIPSETTTFTITL